MNEYDTYIYMYLSFTVTGFYIYNHMRIRCDILYCEVQMKSNPSAEAAVSLWQLLGSGSVVATPSNLLRKKHLVSHHGGGIDLRWVFNMFFLLTKISWLSWLSQFFVFFCCAYETLSPFSNWEESILVEVGVSLQLTGQLPFGQLGGS